MKLGAIVAAVLLACGALAATYWIARSNASGTKAAAVVESDEPTPSKTGPHPKAVVPETTFEFGVMRMGKSKEHAFVVRNEGQAPLKLGTPRTTCQCTVSEAAKKPIPPGGEGVITLKWTPAAETDSFDKGAYISTNDPKMREIRLTAVGKVEALIVRSPNGVWKLGDLDGDQQVDIAGYLYSRLLDDFKVESVESSNPLLTAEAIPIDAEELKEKEAKSGYKIVAKLASGMPIGRFKEKLTVKTDVKDDTADVLTIDVEGTRNGPIQILPTPGVNWSPASLAVDLGQFPASKGASAKVSLFVSGMPAGEDFKFEAVKPSEPYVELKLEKDESFTAANRQRFELTFIVPPGSPAVVHRSKGAVKVAVTTNHPEAREMKFFVQLVSKP